MASVDLSANKLMTPMDFDEYPSENKAAELIWTSVGWSLSPVDIIRGCEFEKLIHIQFAAKKGW